MNVAKRGKGPVGAMKRGHVTQTLLLGTVAAVGLGGAACAEFEPETPKNFDQTKVVSIVIDPDDWTQAVLGEAYKQALTKDAGRLAVVHVRVGEKDSADSASMLSTGRADLYISCTGRELKAHDAKAAAELSKEYTTDEDRFGSNRGQWCDRTYKELMARLGNRVDATDPSNAMACKQDQEFLPQSIVPLYRMPVFNRSELATLNHVTARLAQIDFDELVSYAQSHGSAATAVNDKLFDE